MTLKHDNLSVHAWWDIAIITDKKTPNKQTATSHNHIIGGAINTVILRLLLLYALWNKSNEQFFWFCPIWDLYFSVIK